MKVTYTKWGKERKATGGKFIKPRTKTKITKHINKNKD
jgi:hypothetical protein